MWYKPVVIKRNKNGEDEHISEWYGFSSYCRAMDYFNVLWRKPGVNRGAYMLVFCDNGKTYAIPVFGAFVKPEHCPFMRYKKYPPVCTGCFHHCEGFTISGTFFA